MYTMIGVVPLLSHPKKVGRVLRPPLRNPLTEGTRGILIDTFWFWARTTARSYVVRRAVPSGQEKLVSAEESNAMMASTLRYGTRSGSSGTFWFVSPASTRVM